MGCYRGRPLGVDPIVTGLQPPSSEGRGESQEGEGSEGESNESKRQRNHTAPIPVVHMCYCLEFIMCNA